MTASTVKSTAITNLEASPVVVRDRRSNGVVRNAYDAIEVATTSIDEIGDVILCGTIPSNARVRRVVIRNEALDSDNALTVDVGLYYSGIGHLDRTKTSGTVVDADCFASAITLLRAANVAGTDVRVESTDTIDEVGMEAWEAAGLSADCGGHLHIGITVTAAATSADAGKLVVEVDYVV